MSDLWDHIRNRWEVCDEIPPGTLLITDMDGAKLIRGGRATLEHVRKGILRGVIVENIGHGEETDGTGRVRPDAGV